VPQVCNARRFHGPLQAHPTITRIVDACEQLPGIGFSAGAVCAAHSKAALAPASRAAACCLYDIQMDWSSD